MFLKSYQYLFFLTLIFGSLAAVSANSWFTCWLGLEINLMSMIPLMLIKLTKPLTEAAIKYFLVQAMASTLMIVSVASNLFSSQALFLETSESLLLISLLMKAGTPPLHFWFTDISTKLNWSQCIILFTWQKMAPLLLMFNIKLNKILLVTALAVSVGALGGLNQLNMKSLMAYSSISHGGWIIISAFINSCAWVTYFLIYCIMSVSIILLIKKASINKLNEITSCKESTPTKMMLIFNMLSLAGLPPFLGFLAKLSVLAFFVSLNLKMLMVLFLMMSLVSLYYYARTTYSSMMTKQATKKISQQNQSTPSISLTICATLNILSPLIVTPI